MAQQRHYYNKYNGTRMTPQRVKFLNAIDFVWDIKEARWQEQYRQLKHFRHTFNHTLVRQNSTLGHWIYKQRYYDRCVHKQEMLDLKDIPPAALLRNTESTTDHKHDDDDNDDDDNDDHTETVITLSNGGKMYKGKVVSPLTPTHRTLLDDIGFIWDHWDYVWETNFEQLVEFKEKHGHTRVTPTKNPKLYDWVRKHRAKWRKIHDKKKDGDGTQEEDGGVDTPVDREDTLLFGNEPPPPQSTVLRPDRIRKLDSVGFEWVVRKLTWDDNYRHLLHYKSINGHANVPQAYDDPANGHPNLGPWVSTQRVSYRKGKMPLDRFEKMDAVGIVWEPKLEKFRERALEVEGYRRRQKEEEGGKQLSKTLRKWVEATTEEYEKHLRGEPCSLDEERIKILDDVGFL